MVYVSHKKMTQYFKTHQHPPSLLWRIMGSLAYSFHTRTMKFGRQFDIHLKNDFIYLCTNTRFLQFKMEYCCGVRTFNFVNKIALDQRGKNLEET